MSVRRSFAASISAALLLTASLLVGCDNKEEVLDIETPGVDIAVERDRDTGEVDVNIDDK